MQRHFISSFWKKAGSLVKKLVIDGLVWLVLALHKATHCFRGDRADHDVIKHK